MEPLLPAKFIRRKRDGQELGDAEIQEWIKAYTDGTVTDYQMSAFLMAVYFRGMTNTETLAMVKAMMASGEVLTWPGHDLFKVDKHSTGGIGDKTSLILAPIVAAAGLAVPMMSGRGLGHTGGTLDKLESVPGFNTQTTLPEFDRLVRENRMGMIGQTTAICPADRKMYALRDVTGTVESLPLVCASIMSKKLAEGIDGLVLDVKYGNGAFFKDQEKARELGKALKAIGTQYGKKVVVLLTDMNQPLGAFAGNALEIFECHEILKGATRPGARGQDLYADTRALSLELAAQMLQLGRPEMKIEACRAECDRILKSGEALKAFELMLSAQGGRLAELPHAEHRHVVKAPRAGYIHAFETEKIGYLNVALGAGRLKVTDTIDPVSGMEFHAKVGDRIEAGEALVTVYGRDAEKLRAIENDVTAAIHIGEAAPSAKPLILATL
ncbi:MAG: thymidine phosphorylase [Bdellovibrionaceae bacterium]|nr:thymidine phosphorylase [Pseudobdellovibrionaceae bacterium]